ncbi:MAG: PD40 domain-containing protein [Candidatus Zixiibacteriota bacterium]|nr:MAG: PD40 domain-containing protein [candidate division Zixibacteria bacterium]
MFESSLRAVLRVTLSLALIGIGAAQESPVQTGEYLGQVPPDSIPEIFAPGIISVEGRYEYGLAVSPDGNEIFFTADGPGDGLMVMRQVDGVWTKPEAANLTGKGIWEFEAFYTVDGSKVFFSAIEEVRKSRIWYSERDTTGWTSATMLESPVNSVDVFWATFTKDGTIYYTDINQGKIFRSKLVDGAYKVTEDVGLPFGVHPFISPDESFILFNAKDDLYITFRQDDTTWGEPLSLGDQINSSYGETCPSLSPDGKYIFFSRYNEPEEKSNIYWVSSKVIEKLRSY